MTKHKFLIKQFKEIYPTLGKMIYTTEFVPPRNLKVYLKNDSVVIFDGLIGRIKILEKG